MLIINRATGITFFVILVITLLFGLWPLNLWPKNEVHWLSDQSGIEMHKTGVTSKYAPRGIVYSNKSFSIPVKSNTDRESFSLELYLQSKKVTSHNSGTILVFKENQKPANLFLVQWRKSLILRTLDTSVRNHHHYIEVELDDALPKDSTRFLTITSGSDGTQLYLNGEFKKHLPDLFLVSENKSIEGKLILGNSADGRKPWAGKIFGTGIYEDELTQEIIKQHYQSWLLKDTKNLMLGRNIVALYLFDEGQGNFAENSVGKSKQLLIPDRFTNLDKNILEPPWVNFSFDKYFIIDFIVNILGFIPLGIMFTLYLRQIFGIDGKKLFLLTMIYGGLVSLCIELLQVLMPQRHSSLLDLVLNISGLCAGICIVRLVSKLKRRISPG